MLPSDLSFDFQSGPTTHNLEHLPDFFTFVGAKHEMSTEVEKSLKNWIVSFIGLGA
jgi:hypothetical protein